MKNTWKLLMGVFAAMLLFAACTKEPPLFKYKAGQAPSLALLGDNDFAPSATDSNIYRIKFRWTNPDMATSFSNVKFVTEIDFAGNNFKDPFRSTVFGTFRDSVQNKVLNSWLISKGVPFGEYRDLEARVVASYSNNNDPQISNTVNLRFRAYRIPPRVQLPFTGKLYLIGGATLNGWNNDPNALAPVYEFSRIDQTTFGGIFYLQGGNQYLMLPQAGSWTNKYSVGNTFLAGLENGGEFGYNLPGNFPGPAEDGLYKITVDFQIGRFKVEKFSQQHGLPTQLVVVGGASPWGWNNSTDNPQRLRQLNSVEWRMASIALKANDAYLILPEPGNWGKKYGVPNRNLESARLAGPFVPEGQDFRSPMEAGNYMILMNFFTGTYQLTKQ